MKLDEHLIPLPTERKQVTSLAEQMRNLYKGQSFTVKKKNKFTRGGLYSTAAQAKVKITTQMTPLGEIRVWRTDGEEMSVPPVSLSAIPDEVQMASQGYKIDIETGEVPMSHQEKLDGLRDLMDIVASGVSANQVYGDSMSIHNAYPHEEDWRFTKKPTQYHDNGNVYREQVLYPAGKRFRTVEVDIDDQDTIIG